MRRSLSQPDDKEHAVTYDDYEIDDPNAAARTMQCRDCRQTFMFGVGEQQFFAEQGWPAPKRCRECRAAKRARAGS